MLEEGRLYLRYSALQDIYLTSEDIPKFYGLPKIHKEGAPLRPMVLYILAVINPLLSKNEHAIKNSEDFVKKKKRSGSASAKKTGVLR